VTEDVITDCVAFCVLITNQFVLFSLSVVFILNVMSGMCLDTACFPWWLWGWGISMFWQGS